MLLLLKIFLFLLLLCINGPGLKIVSAKGDCMQLFSFTFVLETNDHGLKIVSKKDRRTMSVFLFLIYFVLMGKIND